MITAITIMLQFMEFPKLMIKISRKMMLIIIIAHETQSFHVVGRGVPKSNDSTRRKLICLRSQIIGGSAEFETPFGRRRLTCADHTASTRSLHYIENSITTKLLPFYGNTHTSDSHVGNQTTKMVQEATKYVKRCLGGGEEEAIIFCGSGSTPAIKRLQEVMGIAVPSILRERVVKSEERPNEHHSSLLSCRQSLAEVVEIGLHHRGQIDMEALRKNLNFYRDKKRKILDSFLPTHSPSPASFTDTERLHVSTLLRGK